MAARLDRRRLGRKRGGRNALVLFLSGAGAALIITGSSGTLADWTQAVITNSINSAGTAKAVILREVGGSTCTSSNNSTNDFTCTTINKYGGTGTPLSPGSNQQVDVTFTNLGGSAAASFRLAPGSCSQTPTAGTGTPAAANLCTNGDLTVAVSCSPGATYSAGSAWTDLAYSAAAPPTTTKTHTATGGDLNANAQWTCRFTVALIAGAGITSQDITVTQPLVWTLIQ